MTSKFPMPPGPPQQRRKVNLDMSQAKDVACEHCGNYTFNEVFLIKFVSKIIHPEGEEGFLPVPTFACNACGFVNENFLPPYMRKPKTEEPASTEPKAEAPAKPIIEIAR